MKSNTKFAPAERRSAEKVEFDFEEISQHLCSKYFHYFPLPLLVLNEQRQVVFSNHAFMQMMQTTDAHDFLGQRPGEIMQCVHANAGSGGCGTSEFCRECGAIRAVLESMQNDSKSTHDCQLLQSIEGKTLALDLRIHAAPFVFEDSKYYVLTVMDIADEKNREVMERVFFHDILNSAGSAKGLVDLLRSEDGASHKQDLDLLSMALYGLVEEIQTQKELRLAEKGIFHLSMITIQSFEMVETVAQEFRSHQAADGKTIEILSASENHAIKTDYSLLRRVLINMLKNALEATPTGGVVRIGCHSEQSGVVFEVHNEQVMEQSVQLQIFKRSFSTKGKGRGLGTYSIKLLTENYLTGKASFESNENTGTIFKISLPCNTSSIVDGHSNA